MPSGPKVGSNDKQKEEAALAASIRQENAELVEMGFVDPDEEGNSSAEPPRKKTARMAAGSQLLLQVVSSMNKFQQMEKVRIGRIEILYLKVDLIITFYNFLRKKRQRWKNWH